MTQSGWKRWMSTSVLQQLDGQDLAKSAFIFNPLVVEFSKDTTHSTVKGLRYKQSSGQPRSI